MFWFLLAVLVLLSLAVLVLQAISLKRTLGRTGRDLGATLAPVLQLVGELQGARPAAPATCPTCGGPNPPVAARSAAGSR